VRFLFRRLSQAHNNLLEQYFKSKGVLAEVIFEDISEAEIETVHDPFRAWKRQLALEEALKSEENIRESR
jgi:hypothetical protein